jgi:radical SAM superfamily enzyme YgiQ (UPF0313 family)
MQRPTLETLIGRCNALGKKIVIGGPFVNTSYAEIKGADHYWIGEAVPGEINTMFRDIAAGRAKKVYGHVADQAKADAITAYFKGDANIIVGPRPALTDSLLPRFDLLDRKAYHSNAVQFSAGCPNNCEFCDIWKQFGRLPRLKPVQRLVAELDSLYSLGFRGPLMIVDDNFIGNRAVVKGELLPALAKWQNAHNYPYKLYTQASVIMGDDKALLESMVDAGFNMVFLGIETPVEASLAGTNKKVNMDAVHGDTTELLLKRVHAIQKSGMQVTSGFIMGFDQDPPNIDTLMIDFIEKANIGMAMVGELIALPDTDLWVRLEKEGRMLAGAAGNNTHSFGTNFRTKIPNDQLDAMYKKVLATLYQPNLKSYFGRCDRMLDYAGHADHFARDVRWTEVRAFLHSIAHILPSKQGWQYTKFLVTRLWKDLRHGGGSFPEAVSLSIQGHHLSHITDGAIATHNYSQYVTDALATMRAKVDAAKEAYGMYVKEASSAMHTKMDGARQAVHTAQASASEKMQEWRTSYDESVASAIEQKNTLLHDANRKYAKLKRDYRKRMLPVHEEFVRTVHALYGQPELQPALATVR